MAEKETQNESAGSSNQADQKPAPRTTGQTIEELFRNMLLANAKNQPPDVPKKTMEEHKFWKTQPVSEYDASIDTEGPIETKTVADVATEPQALPAEFEWVTLDITNDVHLGELYDLLYYNYIEDDDETFRFQYSKAFLNWALKPPGWSPELNVGVRVRATGKLVGSITGTPAQLRVRKNEPLDLVEINYLCVHKKLRSKRLAPVLIREVTRRVNLQNKWQALYTAGVVLPKPVSTARYYHRSINWPKLYDVGFSPLPPGSTVAKQVARFQLPEKTPLELRPMTESDVGTVTTLLNAYLQRFDLAAIFSEAETKHWFLGSENDTYGRAVQAYVVETDGKVTDFVSYYGLASSVLGNAKHDTLQVAYSFYYASDVALDKTLDAAKAQAQLKIRLVGLFESTLVLARDAGYDVFNALTLLDNPLFLEELKFGPGDGFLNYYLFNYRAFPISGGVNTKTQELITGAKGVGVVML